jgi:predicted  nucleic acid-binding Zn-ribbon protein
LKYFDAFGVQKIKMENQIKLTPEELDKIQNLREAARNNIQQIGQLNTQKFFLEREVTTVGEQIQNLYQETLQLNESEKQLVDEIVSKYGEGKLDFNSGVYSIN